MMSREIIWVHLKGASQHALRVPVLALLQIDFAQDDVRPAKEWVQPDRFLQGRDRLLPLQLPGVRFAEHVISHREAGIDRDFLLQERDALFEVGTINGDLTQEKISLR